MELGDKLSDDEISFFKSMLGLIIRETGSYSVMFGETPTFKKVCENLSEDETVDIEVRNLFKEIIQEEVTLQ